MTIRSAVRSALLLCCFLCLRPIGCSGGSSNRTSTGTPAGVSSTPTPTPAPIVDGPYVTEVSWPDCAGNPGGQCRPMLSSFGGAKPDPCRRADLGTCDRGGRQVCVLDSIGAGSTCSSGHGTCSAAGMCQCAPGECGRDCSQRCPTVVSDLSSSAVGDFSPKPCGCRHPC